MLSPQATAQPQPYEWAYGEHVSVIGDTGSGKTFLVSRLVDVRQYVVILRTKPDDIVFHGFEKYNRARAMDSLMESRILLEPKYEAQRSEINLALERVWKQGGWTCVIDELLYIERLKLTSPVERLLTQGRSKQISVVVGMQRPVAVTRFAISQSTHVFCFQCEGRDIVTVAEATTPRIARPLSELSGLNHDFVYYNRKSKEIRVGNARRLGEIIRGATGIY